LFDSALSLAFSLAMGGSRLAAEGSKLGNVGVGGSEFLGHCGDGICFKMTLWWVE
jgi:hypothetical protein